MTVKKKMKIGDEDTVECLGVDWSKGTITFKYSGFGSDFHDVYRISKFYCSNCGKRNMWELGKPVEWLYCPDCDNSFATEVVAGRMPYPEVKKDMTTLTRFINRNIRAEVMEEYDGSTGTD